MYTHQGNEWMYYFSLPLREILETCFNSPEVSVRRVIDEEMNKVLFLSLFILTQKHQGVKSLAYRVDLL